MKPCREIIEEVAQKYAADPKKLLVSRHRVGRPDTNRISAIRAEAMYRCAAETVVSLGTIARVFDCDRSSVSTAIHTYADRHGLPHLVTVSGGGNRSGYRRIKFIPQSMIPHGNPAGWPA